MKFLQQIKERYFARVRVGYARAGGKLEEVLRGTSPVRSGNMQRKTRVIPRGEFRLQTLIDTEYASFVRTGTRPHEITPRRASVLSFVWPTAGGRVFFKKVSHPGTRSNPWYDNALADFPRMVQDEMSKLP